MNIIVNADDFGYSANVNNAIVQCFSKKYISRTTIMVNMPNYEEAIFLSQKYNFVNKVGLHLNLTEGIPLTEDIKKNKKFCSKEGFFNGQFRKGWTIFYLTKQDRLCVEKEFIAQIEKYISSGFTLMHIDSHHHIHTIFSIYNILQPIMKKYSFKSIRLSRNIYRNDGTILKRVYKYIMNKKYKRDFNTMDYFGSYLDFDKNREKLGVEVMVHPIIYNKKIGDLINKQRNIISNISQYKY